MAGLTQYSATNLLPEVRVDASRWNRIPAEEEVAETAAAIGKRGIPGHPREGPPGGP
ncbi:MAG: hypothetical protein ABSD81_00405 [Methanomicrobiales archaeon]|jgi:hypothetical protein